MLIQGQSGSQGQNGYCNVSPVNMEQQSFTFYWLAGGGGIQMTYYYTMTNGQSASSTATFNIGAPSSPSISVTPSNPNSNVTIISPPTNSYGNYPVLNDGKIGVPGVVFLASASFPQGNQGSFQWVQLITADTTMSLGVGGVSGPTNAIVGGAELDGAYPYGFTASGRPIGTVTTTSSPNDTAQDSPGAILLADYGEYARSFKATMYLQWIPEADSRCSGDACTIPVPLGSVSWQFSGDAINTLQGQRTQTQSGPVGFPLWLLNAGPQSNGGFGQAGLPSWTQTYNKID